MNGAARFVRWSSGQVNPNRGVSASSVAAGSSHQFLSSIIRGQNDTDSLMEQHESARNHWNSASLRPETSEGADGVYNPVTLFGETESSTTASTGSTGPLLLEGDSYHVSNEGIARTLYRLQSSANDAIEELFDLNNAAKTFRLRHHDQTSHDFPRDIARDAEHDNMVHMGEAVHEVILQEILAGVYGEAGTGSTTWESSLVMALYFSSHPYDLVGDVAELGSGVGLGALLCSVNGGHTLARSITMTDHNPMVLDQCQMNLDAMESLQIPAIVTKLDWYDFLPRNFEKPPTMKKFDTIIACDCAYRQKDIVALAATMTALMRDEKSQIHIFGPINRSGMETLVSHFQDDEKFSVKSEQLKMERFRLEQTTTSRSTTAEDESAQECPFAKRSTTTFLHVVVSKSVKSTTVSVHNISDID